VKTLTIPITGMSCDGCVTSVRNALAATRGVAEAQVKIGEATVQFDPALTNPDTLRKVVARAGYTPAA
jgi:copper chaperone